MLQTKQVINKLLVPSQDLLPPSRVAVRASREGGRAGRTSRPPGSPQDRGEPSAVTGAGRSGGVGRTSGAREVASEAATADAVP